MNLKLFIIYLLVVVLPYRLTSCTILSYYDEGKVLVGNNEDWYIPYTKYWVTSGTDDQYGRIVFSYATRWGQGGMNEKGVFFDWIQTNEDGYDWKASADKKDYKSNLSEFILANSASLDEALNYYELYNEPRLRTSTAVLADTTGQTAFVSWKDGSIEIAKCKGFCVSGYGGEAVVAKHNKLKGSIDKDRVRQLLDTAHQKGDYPTLYSNIYDLKKKVVYLYNFHNFDEEVEIDLMEELRKGSHSVELSTLFEKQIDEESFSKLRQRYMVEEVQSIPIKGWSVLGGGILAAFLSVVLVFRWFGRSTFINGA